MKNISLTFFIFLLSFACYAQVPAPITGTASLCSAATTRLLDVTTGGTWRSGATATATVGSISGIVSGVAAGVASITYAIGADYVVKPVTVNPSPSSITGILNICEGFITLASATSGGTWSVSPTGVAIVEDSLTGWFQGIASGTANVSYTLGTGCYATAVLTVQPTPLSILGGGSACDGGWGSFACSVPVGTAPAGAWSSSDSAVANINSIGGFTNLSSGVTNIIYTITGGCSVSLTWSVFANPPAISGTPSVCAGFTTALSDTSTGGHYTSYWTSSDAAIATVNSGTGVVTGVASGVATITYWASDGCPSQMTMIVNGAPPITGTDLLCVGYGTNLSDAVSGGVWNSSDTAIATIAASTGVVSGVASGTATITYTYGCGISTTTVTVIAGISTIIGTSNLCIGNTTTLTDVTSGGIWSSIDVTIASVDGAGHVIGITPGTTNITYTIGSGCTATSLLTVMTGIGTHSIIDSPSTSCTASDFYISACGVSGSFNVTTWFGDGTSENTALTSSGTCHADIAHTYSASGNYSVKQVLYLGTIPEDSVTFTYKYLYCSTLPIKFYFDANHDCTFDSGDAYILLPGLTEVDSNGIPIDTISATSGLYYKAYGPPGTIYSFRVLSTAGGLHMTCPSTGILYDTIQSIVDEYREKDFGFDCMTGGGAFDLVLNDEIPIAGRNDTWGNILVWNAYCPPINASVTVHFSPKYVYTGWAYPLPDDSTATSLTWNVNSLSLSNTVPDDLLYVLYANPSIGLLTAGDTVHTYVTITPTIGDIDTINNTEIIIDTVKASGDPNEMSVMPSGYMLPGTLLQYTINFENTGTDTAHNIYVMDTLSNNVDPRSLRIVSATAFMNIAIINDGINNIAKFDFPNINLLDTAARHNFDGTVIFTIKPLNGLTDGATVFNHAGIFFDYNAVVMTDTVENIISLITGSASLCADSGITLSELAASGVWSSSNSTASVSGGIVNGLTAGIDTISYTTINSYTITGQSDTTTTAKVITVIALPNAGLISGIDSVCSAATITLTESTSGGAWSASNSNAIVTSGIVTGVTAGIDSIIYTLTNFCGTAHVAHPVTINPLPGVGTIAGITSTCAGTAFVLTEDSTGGAWSSSILLTTIDPVTGLCMCITDGVDTIEYTRVNSCGASVASHIVSVNPIPPAITGAAAVCENATTSLMDAGGGTWSGSNTLIASVDDVTGDVTGISAGTINITYMLSTGCLTTAFLTVNPVPGSITGVANICQGDSTNLSDAIASGVWTCNDVAIAVIDSNSGVVVGVSAGSTAISYTLLTGCYATSTLSISLCPTGVQTVNNNDKIEIYPNPAATELTIKSSDRITSVDITNLLGQTVYSQACNSRQAQVNVMYLPTGVYFVKVNGTEVGKFVKE